MARNDPANDPAEVEKARIIMIKKEYIIPPLSDSTNPEIKPITSKCF